VDRLECGVRGEAEQASDGGAGIDDQPVEAHQVDQIVGVLRQQAVELFTLQERLLDLRVPPVGVGGNARCVRVI
jgi:hypothetical protein